MSSLAYIHDRLPLGSYYYYQQREMVPDSVKALGGVALASALLFFCCLVAGALALFNLYVGSLALGALMGYARFRISDGLSPYRLPVGRIPGVPSGADAAQPKKVA